jgi:integrase
MTDERRFAFTKTRLAELPVPEAARVVYHDAMTPGLTLRITDKGQRSFYFYRKVKGRPIRHRLGGFPETSVENARKACQRKSGAVADGKDLLAERHAERHEQTVGGLWLFWLETHAKQHKRTWQEDERQYNVFLKPWANRKLSTIRKTDVQALHAKVGIKNGRYAANRLLALLRAMFNKAGDIGFIAPNPTAGIKKFSEEKRDRFLHGDDLRAFFASLAQEPHAILRDFFFVSLLTGARRSNVQTARWEDIDFAIGLWRIPETKSGQPVVVPLVAAVVEILRMRHLAAAGSPWVFPSRGKTGHIVEPKAAWARIIKRAGLSDVRPHDLRRSLGSWMAMTGAGLPVVGKMLGHTQPTTTAIYARLAVDPVREAAEKATDAMLQAGGLLSKTEEKEGPSDGTKEG